MYFKINTLLNIILSYVLYTSIYNEWIDVLLQDIMCKGDALELGR